jgi:putative FmdB family regulatory protein
MPIYEYLCPQCNGRFQKLVYGFRDPEGLACPRCGSTNVRRAISRVAVLKSEESRIEALADPSMLAGLDENDPRSIARWAKKLGRNSAKKRATIGTRWWMRCWKKSCSAALATGKARMLKAMRQKPMHPRLQNPNPPTILDGRKRYAVSFPPAGSSGSRTGALPARAMARCAHNSERRGARHRSFSALRAPQRRLESGRRIALRSLASPPAPARRYPPPLWFAPLGSA